MVLITIQVAGVGGLITESYAKWLILGAHILQAVLVYLLWYLKRDENNVTLMPMSTIPPQTATTATTDEAA